MSAPLYQPYYGQLNILTPNNADFTFATGAFAIGGVTVNMAGATQKMQVRRTASDVSPLLDFGVTANTTLVNGGALGTITGVALKAAMILLQPGIYVWDLVITLSGGSATNWLMGNFTVALGVSR